MVCVDICFSHPCTRAENKKRQLGSLQFQCLDLGAFFAQAVLLHTGAAGHSQPSCPTISPGSLPGGPGAAASQAAHSSPPLAACGSAARWIRLLYRPPDGGPGLTEETNVELKPRKNYLSAAVMTSGINHLAGRMQKYRAEWHLQFH